MTFYDSSFLIEYLDGDEDAVAYVEAHLDERAITTPLVLFEVFQGEMFKSGPADFEAVDRALGWLSVVDESAELARGAGDLQNELQQRGVTLAGRDAFIAGAAMRLDERLAVNDSNFDVEGMAEILDVDFA